MAERSPGPGRVRTAADAGVTIRAASPADSPTVAELRASLWPEGSVAEHLEELPSWLADPDTCSFVAERYGEMVGLLEGRCRSHADGCATSPVGYLEGWYVVPQARRRGVGRALVAAFEGWAVERGCSELASDTWPENAASIEAHRRLGFQEVDRVVTFRKALVPDIALPPRARPPARWEGGA
jgi:aminoglycoside 6'-N-acetyltransferase I